MLNMALLLRVVNEGEHVVVNQVVEEVNPSVEVGTEPKYGVWWTFPEDGRIPGVHA